MTLTSETRAPVGTREAPKLNGKERRLLSGMACGGLLYVYVDADGGVDGDLEPDDPDREERTFDAMKAAIQRADHIARTGRTGER